MFLRQSLNCEQITPDFDDKGKAILKACSAKSQSECKRKHNKLKNQFIPIQGKAIATTKKSYVDYLFLDLINEKRDVEPLEEATIQIMLDILREHRKNLATGKFVFPTFKNKDKPQITSNICRV